MKTVSFIFLTFFTASCIMGNSTSEEPASAAVFEKKDISEITTQNKDTLKFQYVNDKKTGMVQYRTPLPATWLIHQEANPEVFISAPNNIKVNNAETVEYAYANDPFMLQTLQMSGKQIAPVYPIEQIVEQFIKPSAAAQGYTFIKSYPLPGVLSFWEKFSAGMPQTGSQREYRTLGTEWKDDSGNYSFIILVQSILTKGQAVLWSLQTTELEAPSAYFNTAKETYLYGVANTEINPQWQQMMNGKLMGQIRQNQQFWALKTEESARAHRQRMQAIEARGNAAQSVAKTYSEISDISHAGFLKRSDMNSAGHSKTINMIGEQAVITNQNTGERYNVAAGNNYYWVNNNGEYFGTDNALYDPRIDNKINGSEWVKFEKEN